MHVCVITRTPMAGLGVVSGRATSHSQAPVGSVDAWMVGKSVDTG